MKALCRSHMQLLGRPGEICSQKGVPGQAAELSSRDARGSNGHRWPASETPDALVGLLLGDK